ncbi:MAG TPA: porin [Caldimonas sp.]|jgi:predicted porin
MLRLTRSIRAALVAGVALLCSAGANAQSATLYGVLDASGAHVKPVGGQGAYFLDSGDLTRSFIGFRGAEDLGGGLRAVYKLESYVRLDIGTVGRSASDTFFSRESSVGLSGAFGTTVLGRTASPLWLTTINFNPFGEAAGFSPSARQYFGGGGAMLGDTRWNNSINYANSSTDAPLRINVAANLANLNGMPQLGHNYGGSVAYITGPFAVAAAVERIRNSGQALPAGFDRQKAFQLDATYDFKILRVYGQVGRVKTEANEDLQTILYQLGAAVPIGNGLVMASYGRSHMKGRLSGTTDRSSALGYDYFLSKNTDIYVAALYEKLSFVSSGNSVAGGVRIRF